MDAFPTTEAGYMTFIKAWKKEIWLKGLLTESGYELRLVAGIATSVLVNGGSQSEVLTQREDRNEVAFAVAGVDKIYAHELLTFNDTVACEVISKWKAGLKEDMGVRSDVYVLSNGSRKSSGDSHDYYWEIHNKKLVKTLWKGHFTLSLEDSLSWDYNVEKNGTGSMQVLHRLEFEVELLGDHTFEAEHKENVDQGAGLQRNTNSRFDGRSVAFAVAAVDKIYAHELLTFNDTVACEVISKWKAGLKEDMGVRSDMYVLSNGSRKSSGDSHDYYWEIHNEKLVKTWLKGHFTLSLEDSLSWDYNVEKN
nr:zinc finger, CCHC-type [Tanacetum cinerariifolium]